MMTKSELATRIRAVAELRGSFLLRSGVRSDTYFDKYQFEADPFLLRAVAEAMCRLVPKGTQVVAGLEMGGIPLAVVMGQLLGLPTAFIRKKPKEYGTCKFAEGASLQGKKVLLVEDVVTSGGALLDAASALRNDGISLADVVCAIERTGHARRLLEDAGLVLNALLTQQDLEAAPKSHALARAAASAKSPPEGP